MWTVMTWVENTPLDHATIIRGDHAADLLAAPSKRCMWRRSPTRRMPRTSAPTPLRHPPQGLQGGPEHFLAAVDLDGFGFAEDDIRAVWDDVVATPEWPGPWVWVHGDPHPANVVIADGTLAGIVDLGALFAGDAAWDLGTARLLLPAGSASRFFDSYAQADERRSAGRAGWSP
jgi:hypothetical protein